MYVAENKQAEINQRITFTAKRMYSIAVSMKSSIV